MVKMDKGIAIALVAATLRRVSRIQAIREVSVMKAMV